VEVLLLSLRHGLVGLLATVDALLLVVQAQRLTTDSAKGHSSAGAAPGATIQETGPKLPKMFGRLQHGTPADAMGDTSKSSTD
jgi:hypothetical protein